MANPNSKGLSSTAKVAVLAAFLGVPLLFFASSYGLQKLFSAAPLAIVAVVIILSTVYTAHTVKLMYDYYEVETTPLRYVPFICDLQMIDLGYRKPCYILYIVSVVLMIFSQLPYSIVSAFGEQFAFKAPFISMVLAILLLVVVQIIKGVGIIVCMRDIGGEWHRMTHVSVGATDKLAWLGFIPFVRTIAFYSLNKPLSSMVEFMQLTKSDTEEDDSFEEE